MRRSNLLPSIIDTDLRIEYLDVVGATALDTGFYKEPDS
jgi:hypothetical protein